MVALVEGQAASPHIEAMILHSTPAAPREQLALSLGMVLQM